MKIVDYLREVEPAVCHVIDEVHREQKQVEQLQASIARLDREIEANHRQVDALILNPDLDDEGLATFLHWDSHFGVEKERYHAGVRLEDVGSQLEAHRFSQAALAGAILQYAKQALAARYGKSRTLAPEGRAVVPAVCLRDLIWAGRNQAMHWEEGGFHDATTTCFDALAAACGSPFQEYRQRSVATEVLGLLSWKSFDDFQRDLLTLEVA